MKDSNKNYENIDNFLNQIDTYSFVIDSHFKIIENNISSNDMFDSSQPLISIFVSQESKEKFAKFIASSSKEENTLYTLTEIYNKHKEIFQAKILIQKAHAVENQFFVFIRLITTSTLYCNEILNKNLILQNLFSSVPFALISLDMDLKIVYMNYKAEYYSKVLNAHAIGKKYNTIFPFFEIYKDKIQEVKRTKKTINITRIKWKNYSNEKYLKIVIAPLNSDIFDGIIIRISDDTEMVKYQNMLVQTEKIFSLSRLSVGMAHELSNPIAGLFQNYNLLVNRLFKDNPKNRRVLKEANINFEDMQKFRKLQNIEEVISRADEQCDRAQKIIYWILHLAKKDDANFAYVSIQKLLDNALEVTRNDILLAEINFKTKLHSSIAENVPELFCNVRKMEIVIVNILRNICHKFEIDKTENPLIFFNAKIVDNFFELVFEENSEGYTSDERNEIFEPFSKAQLVQDNLGLSMFNVHFIITEIHQGSISVESKPNSNTKYRILIPIQINNEIL